MAKKVENKFSNNVNIQNRKARHEYEFLDTFTTGMVLTGTEIKSIRESRVNLQDAFCVFQNNELFVKQMQISPYSKGSHYNHDADRIRKLLMSKKELQRLSSKMTEKGLTIVPTRLFINDRGLAKLNIALAKGKKLFDKRQDIKQKDLKREIDRAKF